MFTCDWIMTFFSGFYSKDSLLSFGILDNVMVDGWSAVQRVAIALLRLHEDSLMKAKDIGQISSFINYLRCSEDEYAQDLLLYASEELLPNEIE
jgi:hypothetical protein